MHVTAQSGAAASFPRACPEEQVTRPAPPGVTHPALVAQEPLENWISWPQLATAGVRPQPHDVSWS